MKQVRFLIIAVWIGAFPGPLCAAEFDLGDEFIRVDVEVKKRAVSAVATTSIYVPEFTDSEFESNLATEWRVALVDKKGQELSSSHLKLKFVDPSKFAHFGQTEKFLMGHVNFFNRAEVQSAKVFFLDDLRATIPVLRPPKDCKDRRFSGATTKGCKKK